MAPSGFWNRVVHFCTFVLWFVYHCAHPPVDMWRMWRSGYDWRRALHSIYLAASGNNAAEDSAAASVAGGGGGAGERFDSAVDFAAVAGCTTGVGFEAAAGLAACGLSVIAGMRGSAATIDEAAAALRARAIAIRRQHQLGGNGASAHDSFVPVVIPLHVDVSDMESCARFAGRIAALLGCGGTAAEASSPSRKRSSSSSAAPAAQRGNAKADSSSSSASQQSANTAAVNGKRKLLRIIHLNAAILMTDFERTPQGFEAQAATNALGHMVIAEHLLHSGVFGGKIGEPVAASDAGATTSSPADLDRDCRIVFTSSSGARFGDPLRNTLARNAALDERTYCQFKMYGDSKALVAAYALLLQRRVIRAMLDGRGPRVSVRAFHPGCIASRIVYDSGMYGAHALAYLQSTVGIAIGAMVSSETASAFVLRMLLGAAGKLKHVPFPPSIASSSCSSSSPTRLSRGGKAISGGSAALTAEQERAAFAGEERELFSYIHQFEPDMMGHFLKNAPLLEAIRGRVCETMGEFMPGGKSLLEC